MGASFVFDDATPTPRSSVEGLIYREREVVKTALRRLEQRLYEPRIFVIGAASISAASPPAALVLTGAGFGVDYSVIYLRAGANAPVPAAESGHSDTQATFDLSAAAFVAGSLVTLEVIRYGTEPDVAMHSDCVQIPVVA